MHDKWMYNIIIYFTTVDMSQRECAYTGDGDGKDGDCSCDGCTSCPDGSRAFNRTCTPQVRGDTCISRILHSVHVEIIIIRI